MFLLVVLGPILLQPYYGVNLRQAAKEWPSTNATIIQVYNGIGPFKRRYRFSYYINGKKYMAKEKIKRYTSTFSQKSEGTRVKVHYDPKYPYRIVVAQEDANVIYNRTKDLVYIGGGIAILVCVVVIKKKERH